MFATANRYLWMIVLIGLALGVANYSLGVWDTLGRSILLQVVISLAIGYPTILLVTSNNYVVTTNRPLWQKWALRAVALFLIGAIATEIQLLADVLFFSDGPYRPFAQGGVYVFNGILCTILGLMTYRWLNEPVAEESRPPDPERALDRIPIKQGESTVLHAVGDIYQTTRLRDFSLPQLKMLVSTCLSQVKPKSNCPPHRCANLSGFGIFAQCAYTSSFVCFFCPPGRAYGLSNRPTKSCWRARSWPRRTSTSVIRSGWK